MTPGAGFRRSDRMSPGEISEAFYSVRDAPFQTSGKFGDYASIVDSFRENRAGSCTPKHIFLGNLLGSSVSYVASRFLWKDLEVDYPSELRRMAEKLGPTMHLYLNYLGDGLIVPGDVASLDATWDFPLKRAGFRVGELSYRENSGNTFLEGTLCGVNPLDERKFTDPTDCLNYLSENRAVGEPLRREFYWRLDSWLKSLRADGQKA